MPIDVNVNLGPCFKEWFDVFFRKRSNTNLNIRVFETTREEILEDV